MHSVSWMLECGSVGPTGGSGVRSFNFKGAGFGASSGFGICGLLRYVGITRAYREPRCEAPTAVKFVLGNHGRGILAEFFHYCPDLSCTGLFAL